MTHSSPGLPIEVFFGTTNEGKWVAATKASPFFFFEADSEEDIRETVREAIRFFSENRDNLRRESPTKEQAFQLPTFNDVSKELLYA